MIQPTTIELDLDLLERTKRALGESTTSATVDRALRLAADNNEFEGTGRASLQRRHRQIVGERVAVSATRLDPVAWLAAARAFRESLTVEPLTDRELRDARRAGRD